MQAVNQIIKDNVITLNKNTNSNVITLNVTGNDVHRIAGYI